MLNGRFFGLSAALVVAALGCGGSSTTGDPCAACTIDQICVADTCRTLELFDSLTGAQSASTRGAGDSCGTQISVTSNALLMGLSVHNTLNAAGNIKFLIFDHSNHAKLYESVAQPVAAGAGWKTAAYFEFPLEAGKTYDIGAITDVSGTWTYDTVIEAQPGIASTKINPNFGSYATPGVPGHGAADCGIQFDYYLE